MSNNEKQIHCAKLGKMAPALATAPVPGPLGQRILENISQPAWQQWLAHQTLLINENRLSLFEAKSREFLAKEMEAFFFGEGSAKPAGFIEN